MNVKIFFNRKVNVIDRYINEICHIAHLSLEFQQYGLFNF